MYDIETNGNGWFYSDDVKEHFFNPQNLVKGRDDADTLSKAASGFGTEGSPACGDMMKMWITVEDGKITNCKWQTFGCASAIASTSMFSVMITENGGMTIDAALQIKPQDIVKRLSGLPSRKFHCSVLADKALRAAVNDYFKKSGQEDKVDEAQVKIIDKILKITDHDIEDAVLEGVRTFDQLQKRTKIGIQDKTCIPEAEELLRFYIEKYFAKELQEQVAK